MEKYGKLTVLNIDHTKKYNNGTIIYFVKCKCDCGNEKIVNYNNLKRGLVKSCGCIVKTAYGLSKTRLYKIYKHMKERCYSPKDINYKNYGKKGICVCQEWLDDFIIFQKWALSNGYSDKLTIDRINVNGNYEPSNCRWIDIKTQQRNRSNNRILEYKGEKKTITEWAEIVGLKYRNLYYRLNNGYSIEEALEKPKRKLKNQLNA